ncbi:MAG: YfiR/HmsC family protein [Byssovorax sp.]
MMLHRLRLLSGAALIALAALLFCRVLRADDVTVPIAHQMDLLAKVASYDRNLAARAGDQVKILLLTRAGNDESTLVAGRAEKALSEKGRIAGLPHAQTAATFSDGPSLAARCKAERIAIVYVTPGFSDAEIEAIGKALAGADVLTASAVPSFVPKGLVLGFDLVSGRARLLVHLSQAKKQHVDFSSDILDLAQVIR